MNFWQHGKRRLLMRQNSEIMVIPQWIGGRAYLSPGERLLDVCEPASGQVLRRLPLAGTREIASALAAARAALPAWQALNPVQRQAPLAALAAALAGYAEHFAGLLAAESGISAAAAAQAIVDGAKTLACGEVAEKVSGNEVVLLPASKDFVAVLAALKAHLLAGHCLLLRADVDEIPGVLFALCELSGRAQWPAGVVNLIYAPASDALAGDAALCATVLATAAATTGATA